MQPLPVVDLKNLSNAELNIAVAKAAGYWVYHYDKDHPSSCYYMLCLPDSVDSVVVDDFSRFRESGWHAGERKTEEEAWKDAPYFSTDLNKIWPLFKEHNLIKPRGYFPKPNNQMRYWLNLPPERAARELAETFVCALRKDEERK